MSFLDLINEVTQYEAIPDDINSTLQKLSKLLLDASENAETSQMVLRLLANLVLLGCDHM